MLSLTVTATPTLGQLKIWWSEMQNDPTRPIVYTDFMPYALEEFLIPVQQGAIQVYLFLLGDAVGGAYYLHDQSTDADGASAWLGAYILPPYRGRHATQAWHLTLQHCAATGLSRIFAAIRACNRPAQCFITHQMGFTRLGVYTDWSSFEGRLDDVVLYTLRRHDQSLAWVTAEQRARQFRRLSRPVRAGERPLREGLPGLAPREEPQQVLTASKTLVRALR
jgi:RimJ/RimL family protein N-acetyltransferase